MLEQQSVVKCSRRISRCCCCTCSYFCGINRCFIKMPSIVTNTKLWFPGREEMLQCCVRQTEPHLWAVQSKMEKFFGFDFVPRGELQSCQKKMVSLATRTSVLVLVLCTCVAAKSSRQLLNARVSGMQVQKYSFSRQYSFDSICKNKISSVEKNKNTEYFITFLRPAKLSKFLD